MNKNNDEIKLTKKMIIGLVVLACVIFSGFDLIELLLTRNKPECPKCKECKCSNKKCFSGIKEDDKESEQLYAYKVFHVLKNNEKYEFESDSTLKQYITLEDGVPTILKGDKIIKSNITNVDKIYLLAGDFNKQYAFLTKNGEVYIGNSYVSYVEGLDFLNNENEFNDVKKVKSNEKFVSLNLIEIIDNPEWTSDDVIEYHLIGITKSGKKELIEFDYLR